MLQCMLWKEHNHGQCSVTSPSRCRPPHIQGTTMDHQECMSMAGRDIFGGSHVVQSDSPHKLFTKLHTECNNALIKATGPRPLPKMRPIKRSKRGYHASQQHSLSLAIFNDPMQRKQQIHSWTWEPILQPPPPGPPGLESPPPPPPSEQIGGCPVNVVPLLWYCMSIFPKIRPPLSPDPQTHTPQFCST